MKVLDGVATGLSKGARISVRELGLPVGGAEGVLIVFWKDR